MIGRSLLAAALAFLVISWAPGELPKPGEGKLLLRREIDGGAVDIIQIPRKARPFIPVFFFVYERVPVSGGLFNRIENARLASTDARRSHLLGSESELIQQIDQKWAVVEKTFRAEGTHRLEIPVAPAVGFEGAALHAEVAVEPNTYMKFFTEFGLFVLATIGSGLAIFSAAAFLKRKAAGGKHE